jgi:hypothetical protein
VTTKRQKHMDESWVVKANRERDRLQDEESRAKFEEFREDIKARLKGPHAASQYEPVFQEQEEPRAVPPEEGYDEVGNALCYGCLDEVVDQEGTLCDECDEEDEFRV